MCVNLAEEYRQLALELIEEEEQRVSSVGGSYEDHSGVRRWMSRLAEIDRRRIERGPKRCVKCGADSDNGSELCVSCETEAGFC
jgi:hypothetical protein